MPAMVIEAHRKRFNPSIGPKPSLIDRWLHSVAHFAMSYSFRKHPYDTTDNSLRLA